MINPLQTNTGGFKLYQEKRRLKKMIKRYPLLIEEIKNLHSEVSELKKVNARLQAVNEALSAIMRDSLDSDELDSVRALRRIAKKLRTKKKGDIADGDVASK